MEELWDEVQSLRTTMKQWEVVTLKNQNHGTTRQQIYPFDSKFSAYNFCVLSGSSHIKADSSEETEFYINNSGRGCGGNGSGSITWSKSGNNIIASGGFSSQTVTVLFYK